MHELELRTNIGLAEADAPLIHPDDRAERVGRKAATDLSLSFLLHPPPCARIRNNNNNNKSFERLCVNDDMCTYPDGHGSW